MPSSHTFFSIANELKQKLNFVLEKLYIFSRVKDVQDKTNAIVTKAEISAQSEMLGQTLAEREKQLAKNLNSQKDIRQAKDLTRQDMYTTLIKGKRDNKAKNSFTK